MYRRALLGRQKHLDFITLKHPVQLHSFFCHKLINPLMPEKANQLYERALTGLRKSVGQEHPMILGVTKAWQKSPKWNEQKVSCSCLNAVSSAKDFSPWKVVKTKMRLFEESRLFQRCTSFPQMFENRWLTGYCWGMDGRDNLLKQVKMMCFRMKNQLDIAKRNFWTPPAKKCPVLWSRSPTGNIR